MKIKGIPPVIILCWPEFHKKRFSYKIPLLILSGLLCLILILGISYDFVLNFTAVDAPVSHGFSVISDNIK